MFPPFFEIFQVGMLRSFMSKTQNGLPKGLVHRAKIGRQTKNVDFFQSRRYVNHDIPGGKETP